MMVRKRREKRERNDPEKWDAKNGSQEEEHARVDASSSLD